MAPKLTQALIEAAWRWPQDGEPPTYEALRKENKDPSETPEKLASLPFNPEKCDTRIYREGWGVQCSRDALDGEAA
jgi:hypothetical protein